MDPTLELISFLGVSLVTLVAGAVVVFNRNLFHAALALMGSFLGVAGIYVLLDAGFLAAAQLLVYIGAISILIIFAIMMTRRLMQTTERPFNSQWQMGAFTALVVAALLIGVIVNYWPTARAEGARTVVPEAILRDSTAALGRSFVDVDAFVLPFELASVLLLAALVGSIVVAWPRGEGDS